MASMRMQRHLCSHLQKDLWRAQDTVRHPQKLPRGESGRPRTATTGYQAGLRRKSCYHSQSATVVASLTAVGSLRSMLNCPLLPLLSFYLAAFESMPVATNVRRRPTSYKGSCQLAVCCYVRSNSKSSIFPCQPHFPLSSRSQACPIVLLSAIKGMAG